MRSFTIYYSKECSDHVLVTALATAFILHQSFLYVLVAWTVLFVPTVVAGKLFALLAQQQRGLSFRVEDVIRDGLGACTMGACAASWASVFLWSGFSPEIWYLHAGVVIMMTIDLIGVALLVHRIVAQLSELVSDTGHRVRAA